MDPEHAAAHLRALPAPARRGGLPRHGHRPGRLRADRRPARRAHLGRRARPARAASFTSRCRPRRPVARRAAPRRASRPWRRGPSACARSPRAGAARRRSRSAACGGGGDDDADADARADAGPPIRIGTKNFTEQVILGELYARRSRPRASTSSSRPTSAARRSSTARCAAARWTCTPSTSACCCRRSPRSPTRPAQRARRPTRSPRRFEERNGFTLLEPDAVQQRERARRQAARSPRATGCAGSPTCKRLKGDGAGSARCPSSRPASRASTGCASVYGLRNARRRRRSRAPQRYPALDERQGRRRLGLHDRRPARRRRLRRCSSDPRGRVRLRHVAPVDQPTRCSTAHGPKLRGDDRRGQPRC